MNDTKKLTLNNVYFLWFQVYYQIPGLCSFPLAHLQCGVKQAFYYHVPYR